MRQTCEQQSSWAELVAAAIEGIGQLELSPLAVDELLERAFFVNGNETVN